MKYDLTSTIYDLDGKIAEQKYRKTEIDNDGHEVEKLESKPITLGLVIRDAVLQEIDDVKNVKEEEHLLRYDLFEKVNGKDEATFIKSEVDFIKGLICKRYLPIFAGQLLNILNK